MLSPAASHTHAHGRKLRKPTPPCTQSWRGPCSLPAAMHRLSTQPPSLTKQSTQGARLIALRRKAHVVHTEPHPPLAATKQPFASTERCALPLQPHDFPLSSSTARVCFHLSCSQRHAQVSASEPKAGAAGCYPLNPTAPLSLCRGRGAGGEQAEYAGVFLSSVKAEPIEKFPHVTAFSILTLGAEDLAVSRLLSMLQSGRRHLRVKRQVAQHSL